MQKKQLEMKKNTKNQVQIDIKYKFQILLNKNLKNIILYLLIIKIKMKRKMHKNLFKLIFKTIYCFVLKKSITL